jgi:hypothetical protein
VKGFKPGEDLLTGSVGGDQEELFLQRQDLEQVQEPSFGVE